MAAFLNSGGGSNFRFSVSRTSMSVMVAMSMGVPEWRAPQGYCVLRAPRQSGKF
jgi:hypothetical protein